MQYQGLSETGPEDVVGALQRYELARTARAKLLQESSHIAADSFYLPDGEAQRERDAGYAVFRASAKLEHADLT